MNNPEIDLDVAAKARASIIEEGEIGFNMHDWMSCETSACLAGHIVLVADIGVREEAPGCYRPDSRRAWDTEAVLQLFPGLDVDGLSKTKQFDQLNSIFMRTSASVEDVTECFDDFVKEHCSEEEYQSYLHKSYSYQGYYQRHE